MALPELPIDDRTYDQLLAALRHTLPTAYTDHNPSDPAMTVLGLLAWLGEISLYQMSRTPETHQAKFRDLLLDPPEPVTVPVEFKVTYVPGRPHPIRIPAGTRVATDFTDGRRAVFETLRTTNLPAPTDPTQTSNSITLLAREFLEITDELLGLANGRPHQQLPFSPLHSALGLAPDAPAPVLVDEVNRAPDYDPNPQLRVYRGLLNGMAGLGLALPGVMDARFDAAPVEAAFLLSYTPPNLTLTRADGVSQSIGLSATPIAPGTTEAVTFSTFGARLTLGPAFDKTTPLTPPSNQITIAGGPGAIASGSLAVVAASGSVAGITSTDLVLGGLTDPSQLSVTLAGGYTGSFDGSTTGAKQVRLRDATGNTLTLSFTITTAFGGAETAATLRVGVLANLLVFGAEIWTPQHSLLTERTGPLARHVRVDPLARTIEFGDGRFGALPPAGAPVVCRRYQLLRGPASLIEEGEIQHLLTPLADLAAGDSITVSNTDAASGGQHFYRPAERRTVGLEDFRDPYRLVTADDFERVLLQDFNAYQQLAGRPERLARVSAVMNRQPPLADDLAQPGHVTVMVVQNPPTSLDPKLLRRIQRFLEERRLVTTRVHVVQPDFLSCQIEVHFVIDQHANVAEMGTLATQTLARFFDPLQGGADGRGWPLGRNLYRSEIFRLVEALPGVDHVVSLVPSPATLQGDVRLGPHQLPRPQVRAFALRS